MGRKYSGCAVSLLLAGGLWPSLNTETLENAVATPYHTETEPTELVTTVVTV
jgi:hypothetical protein